jgi:hypothetical protein
VSGDQTQVSVIDYELAVEFIRKKQMLNCGWGRSRLKLDNSTRMEQWNMLQALLGFCKLYLQNVFIF